MSQYVLAIDAGTTGVTLVLIDKSGNVVNKEYSEFTQIYPEPGWVEHDALEIWDVTCRLLNDTLKKVDSKLISAIGITNQRETTVLWDRKNGKPVYNAIVWQCRRTHKICEKLIAENLSNKIQNKTGLVIDSYFSATKIKWILDNVDGVRLKAENGDICFGTIDTWIMWKLTNGKVHATDFTNASRTLIFNIDEKKWDQELLDIFDIPESVLPNVNPSSYNFGETSVDYTNTAIRISGIAGDQQSALFGQGGFFPGNIKNTYGTGCFLLLNTGEERIKSNSGLINTLACDFSGDPVYAIEGSVFIAGAVVQWIRDELNLIDDVSESEKIALSIPDTGGVYLVPAFVGLGSPYWNMDARGLMCGITRGTNQSHIVRAALESIAFQVKDLIDSIQSDLNLPLNELKVDGGAANNNFLMQFQADILGFNINKPKNIETTATGAAYLAGLSTGFWETYEDLNSAREIDKIYKPNMNEDEKQKIWSGWKNAINRTINI